MSRASSIEFILNAAMGLRQRVGETVLVVRIMSLNGAYRVRNGLEGEPGVKRRADVGVLNVPCCGNDWQDAKSREQQRDQRHLHDS